MDEIRLNIDDILDNNELRNDIIDSLEAVCKQISIRKVIFWCNGKGHDPVQAKLLTEKLQEQLINTSVKISTKQPQNEFVWFDIISDKHSIGSRNRFSHVYSSDNTSDIVMGIYNFLNIVKFVESNNQGKRVYYKPKEK